MLKSRSAFFLASSGSLLPCWGVHIVGFVLPATFPSFLHDGGPLHSGPLHSGRHAAQQHRDLKSERQNWLIQVEDVIILKLKSDEQL